jgi:ABC-2 type transport system ATP-binding protein
MIEVKDLVKKYGKHVAVDHLSFTVQTGNVVGFLGPNGAGKSTTMNMITGYIAASEGSVLIDGIDITEEPQKAKKNIGYLPEVPPLYPDMRVREYLFFVAELKKVPASQRQNMVHEIMGKTQILDVSERLIQHLSKGYRQRVGLAGAMMGYPDILILDEPTVGLDPSQIIEIRELIRELSKDHTILLSSHIMQEITAVCNEIIIINEGKMITCDTPESLTQKMASNGIHLVIRGERLKIKEALRQVEGIKNVVYDADTEENALGMTLYTSSGNDIREKIFFALAQAQCPILEMCREEMSLEEAFLKLTKGGSRQHAEKKSKTAKEEAIS